MSRSSPNARPEMSDTKALPRSLQNWVKSRSQKGGFADSAAFVRHLIAQAKDHEAWAIETERKVEASIKAGRYRTMDASVLDEVRKLSLDFGRKLA